MLALSHDAVTANSLLKSRPALINRALFAFYALFKMGFSDTVYLHGEGSIYHVFYFNFFSADHRAEADLIFVKAKRPGQKINKNKDSFHLKCIANDSR